MTTELVEVAAPKSESRKSPSMLPYLLGTWTLETHVSSDLGYYKANAFVVMHVMADPLAATYSCSLPDCDELQNQICQRNLDACVDTASSISQWSDGALYYTIFLLPCPVLYCYLIAQFVYSFTLFDTISFRLLSIRIRCAVRNVSLEDACDSKYQ